MADGTSGCGTDRLKRELGTRFGYADFKSKLQERAVLAINGGMYYSCYMPWKACTRHVCACMCGCIVEG